MTSGKFILIYILITAIGVAVLVYFLGDKKSDKEIMREYIDSLFVGSKQTITFDSIQSVNEKRLTDSIRTIRRELDVERSARRRETQIIRNETKKLRHRLDSIGPIDRPDL